MCNPITNEVFAAFTLCPRKAHLLRSRSEQTPIDYDRMLTERMIDARHEYVQGVRQMHPGAVSGATFLGENGPLVFIDAKLIHYDLHASCDVLTGVPHTPTRVSNRYEPTIVIGTNDVLNEKKAEIAYVGYVLGLVQGHMPSHGTVVGADGRTHRVGLLSAIRGVERIIETLRDNSHSSIVPSVFLNPHCPHCPFRLACLEVAEKEDSLSLLSRMTPKIAQRFNKKGVFTVNQLSYMFRPRRVKTPPISGVAQFKFELQAMAIRTGDIYVHRPPNLAPHAVEVFMDIEGVPDAGYEYLIGILVREPDGQSQYSFWADSRSDERQMWEGALARINMYPDAPVYHYGNYEVHSVKRFSHRFNVDCSGTVKRLANINTLIYSKVYFPTRSNTLKDLARFLGYAWTSPDASGLQSLVWRHRWEATLNTEFRDELQTYNAEDCGALLLVTDELRKITVIASTADTARTARRLNQQSTDAGRAVHSNFEAIIRCAHSDYNGKKIVLRPSIEQPTIKKRGRPVGHPGSCKSIPRPTKVQNLPTRVMCPKCCSTQLLPTDSRTERTVIDLVFSRNGCRKAVTRFVGDNCYCPDCHRVYRPEQTIDQPVLWEYCAFGFGFRAWIIYQRIVLRLPYSMIVNVTMEQFNESISQSSISNFVNAFAAMYADTEATSVERMLASPFIHADETKINIQGTNQYVWTFTDGKHVVYRLTETRESDFVCQFLAEYKGVLVSDFYPGYDAVSCRQQKCLIHLIRDLNDDLWGAPYDLEYERFVVALNTLLAPIFEAIGRYGLKRRHLGKYKVCVASFYSTHIDARASKSELVAKYQKRFLRYKESLFLFLDMNGLPWHNNTAENAIRPLAVQRKISGTFYKSLVHQYLTLLGIAQTCKYADKSFLQFLLSREKDVDAFRKRRGR